MAKALALAVGHATRMATLCERRCDITQIKQMVTCCLDAVAHVEVAIACWIAI
ncbi:hypothetical protein BJP36_39615 [Moorena producens JHB]|uniref:Uncharacterized protein n=1 Tax=Moorena producens (strain JHB) TaxID=1454205 RepID=A0A9Q9SV13_MOOP1|nr:hypothetical protein [Moorena producens]WAN70163.1 hypothetical protein BJP36_39615 [Moorena producens JHB]